MSTETAVLFWSAITVFFYLIARQIYLRHPRWWLAPTLLTWVGCAGIMALMKVTYPEYLRGTQWIASFLGPATVAFALIIHEQRALIRLYWPTMLVGITVGSLLALGSAWALAYMLQLPEDWQASLMPRSVTTPFAMAMSDQIGGIPELTASLVAITGLLGTAMGEVLLKRLPLRTAMARGAMLGMGVQGSGTARAYELGREEGAVAALVMILAGLVNVLGATAVSSFWR